MRLFGFELRLLPADPPQTPHVQPTDRVLSYTPEDRVLMAYGDARIVLAHLLRGYSGSKREMQRAGMSNRRWNRAVAMLERAGVIALARSGAPLELTVHDGEQAMRLLRETRRRLLRNCEQPNYTLPFA